MKLIFVFCCFLYCFFLSNCGLGVQPKKSSKSDSIGGLKISRKFPILNNNTGKFLGYELEEANIFYSKDIILHRLPYVHNIFKISINGEAEIDKIELRTSYFIYKKGNSTGFFTDSSRSIYLVNYPVDSILSNYWYMQPFVDPLFEKFQYWIIDSLSVRGKKDVYFFQNRMDSSQTGIITLEFSDMILPLNFTLSNRMDTMQGSRLINVNIVNNARYLKDYDVNVDQFDQNREVRVLKEFNLTEIYPFFEFIKNKMMVD